MCAETDEHRHSLGLPGCDCRSVMPHCHHAGKEDGCSHRRVQGCRAAGAHRSSFGWVCVHMCSHVCACTSMHMCACMCACACVCVHRGGEQLETGRENKERGGEAEAHGVTLIRTHSASLRVISHPQVADSRLVRGRIGRSDRWWQRQALGRGTVPSTSAAPAKSSL